MASKIKVKIRSFGEDAMGAFKVAKQRLHNILHASEKDIEEDPITEKARTLHRGLIKAKVTQIEKDGEHASKITFSAPCPLYFSAGQYLTVSLKLGDKVATRPYSITSSPVQGKEGNVSILVKEKADEPFFSRYLNRDLKVGDELFLEVGLGDLTLNPIRDKAEILGVAGGVGIAPFLSMAKAINENESSPFRLTVLYGSRKQTDILASKEIASLESERVHFINVLSEEPDYPGEKGFITASLIQEYCDVTKVSFFLCGPHVMEEFVLKELSTLGVDIRHVRSECPASLPLPKTDAKTYLLKVHRGIELLELKAREDEPLIIALERAGIYVHSCCRSGKCGACRVEVISGEFEEDENDARRFYDVAYRYAYSCHAYPRSDMEIRIPIESFPA